MRLALRRRLWLGSAVLVGGALLAVSALVQLPFIELSPGPTYNTIGDIAGKAVIEISGTPTFPTSGHLDMTTVNERGGPDTGIYVGRVLIGWADPRSRIVPRESFFPDPVSGEEVHAENVRQFSDSESNSMAAALAYLGRPVLRIVVVSSLLTGSPSDGKLEPGDQILAIGSSAVTSVDDVTAAMSGVTPGAKVDVRVVRGGAESIQSIVTAVSPQDPARAFLGISVGQALRAPFHLTVTLEGVGGPSAGTMFSLGIIDKLTPGELTGGKYVAGTGTITPDGTVGGIGGIEQKMLGARVAGATLFLAPAENCADVLDADIPDGLTVARISTLAEAVAAVEAYAAGKAVTPCT